MQRKEVEWLRFAVEDSILLPFAFFMFFGVLTPFLP